jgi:hypothetical protein
MIDANAFGLRGAGALTLARVPGRIHPRRTAMKVSVHAC